MLPILFRCVEETRLRAAQRERPVFGAVHGVTERVEHVGADDPEVGSPRQVAPSRLPVERRIVTIAPMAGPTESVDRAHWDDVWSTVAPSTVSWFQESPEP